MGAPRTGSTFLFQVITNVLLALYPDNVVGRFVDHVPQGFWLSEKLFRHRPHNCYSSFHGSTRRCGWRAPNELEGFFRKIFSDPQSASAEPWHHRQELLRRVVSSIDNRHSYPLIFKSLRVGQNLDDLLLTLTDVKVIFIRRDPLFTAQSIFLAKAREGVSLDKVWYISPRGLAEIGNLDPYEQIIYQIFLIEQEIMKSLRSLSNEDFRVVNYRDLCSSPDRVLGELENFIGNGISRRPGSLPPRACYSERVLLSSGELARLSHVIKKLDWELGL